MGVTCSRHAPRSRCRFTSRGPSRMRGVGATCTAPTTHGRPKRTSAPECCQIGAGRAQRIRLSVRTATLASQRPVARGFASRSTDWAGRVQAYALTLEIRAKRRELGGPADRQAPIFRQKREGGIRRRMRKQPGAESGQHSCMGMVPSVRAFGMYGARLGGSRHTCGNGGCCKRGAPAQGLRGQSAQPSRHKCDSRSLRETDR